MGICGGGEPDEPTYHMESRVVGHKYYVGVHMILTQGPIDKFTELWVGEDWKVWSGTLTDGNVWVDKEGLFGGEKKGGGIKGRVYGQTGLSTQPRHSYLSSKLGSSCPAFRWLSAIILKDMYIGTQTYPKPWAVTCQKILKNWQGSTIWNSGDAAIGLDMNPAHILYELLISQTFGKGLPASYIDNASFLAAATTLKNENFGLSYNWSSDSDPLQMIGEVLGTINGSLFQDMDNGKYRLELARDDYDVGSLEVFNEDNIIKIKNYVRPSLNEVPNWVIVSYHNRAVNQDRTVTVHDLAMMDKQGGVISVNESYNGVCNSSLATQLAGRELKQYSSLLATMTFEGNRTMAKLRPNDMIKISWSNLGIVSLPVRVLGVEYGSLDNGVVTLHCAEDIFSAGEGIYEDPEDGLWSEPWFPPLDADERLIIEIPYGWLIDRGIYDQLLVDIAGIDSTVLGIAVESPSPDSIDYLLQYRDSPTDDFVNNRNRGFTPTAIIAENEGLLQDAAQATISIENGTGLEIVQDASFCLIGEEILELVSIDLETNELVVKRGMWDTVPKAHTGAINLGIIFADARCVAVWAFDSDSGISRDLKGTNELIIVGSPTMDDAIKKQGLSSLNCVTTNSHYVYLTDSGLSDDFPLKSTAGAGTKFTITEWVYYDVVNADVTFSKDDTSGDKRSFSMAAYDVGGGVWKFKASVGLGGSPYWEGVNFATGPTIGAGKWYHLAFSFDDGTKAWHARIYDENADTVWDDTGVTTNNIYLGTGRLWFGRYSSGGYFDGRIDEVAVFNDILDNTEIDSIRDQTYGGTSYIPGSTKVWFVGERFSEVRKIYYTGDNPAFRPIPRTMRGALPEGSATISEADALITRGIRPYPAINFKIDSVSYPASFTGEPVLTWSHHNRKTSLGQVITANESPGHSLEVGGYYTLKIYDPDPGGGLLRTESPLTGTTYTYELEDETRDAGYGSVGNWFEDDVNCQAVYDMEGGNNWVDKLGNSTLISGYGSTEDAVNFKEGASSAYFNATSNTIWDYDTGVADGFPFKSNDTTKKMSLTGWCRCDSMPGEGVTRMLYSKYDSASVGSIYIGWETVSGVTQFKVAFCYTGATEVIYFPSLALSANNWYHFGLTFDDSDSQAYVLRIWDDVLETNTEFTGNATNPITVNAAVIHIGNWQPGGKGWYGQLDEFVFFSDILTPAEIDVIRAGDYDSLPTSPPTGWIGHDSLRFVLSSHRQDATGVFHDGLQEIDFTSSRV